MQIHLTNCIPGSSFNPLLALALFSGILSQILGCAGGSLVYCSRW